jgi:tetratricopeptide (TPR) repeat protein
VKGVYWCLAITAVAAAASVACSSSARRNLLPTTVPDLSRLDPGVQAQVRERYAELTQAKEHASTDAELSTAFGRYGMVLQAAEYFDAAEPCYLNAERLVPDEMRWPYYLANLYKSRGETDKAEASFKRALELKPDDLATLIWLGRLHLDQGQPDAAEPLFAKAFALAPRTVSVLAGLGRVAVAKRDYTQAVKYLEDALAIDPEADSLHAPLATAYRGLGQLDKAQPHLRQWRNRDLPVPDPLQQDMDLLLESALSYELRGVREFEARDWKAAAAFFSKGVALARANSALSRSLHHKLGTALFLTGDLPGAQSQFEEVVRQAPAEGIDEASAKAHYSLGLLSDQNGQRAQAVAHLSAAVKYQPNYVEAHLAFGDALRRARDPDAALTQYQEAAQINPRSVPARVGYAMTLVTLGRSKEAREWLAEATRLFPDRLEYQHALARLLAGSADASVRDPRGALAIVDHFLQQQHTTDVGETIAMALAGLGDFKQAVGVQRGVMSAAGKAGMKTAVSRMARNLRLYEQQQPCRQPWPEGQPVVLTEDVAFSSSF